MTKKYRKKSNIVIEAWQFTKENYKIGLPSNFKNDRITLFSQYGGDVICGLISTLEGIMIINENDYIIKGSAGEFYPCKPIIFENTYVQCCVL